MEASAGDAMPRLEWGDCVFGSRTRADADRLMSRLLRQFTDGQRRAFDRYYLLPSGTGFAAVEGQEPVALYVESNGYMRTVSAETAGIIVTLFTLNQLAHGAAKDADRDRLDRAFFGLRRYALTRPDGVDVYDAID